MHTEAHLFSVPNDCLWYDKLWGPSQRVVTLFSLPITGICMKKSGRIPGMSSLVAMEFLKSWEGARAWRANQVLLVLLKTNVRINGVTNPPV